jgi:phosphoserine aminotransferase
MNLLPAGKSADYVITGAWGQKALAEAKLASAMLGASVRVACDVGVGEGKAKKFLRVPKKSEMKIDSSATYLHLTSNETIDGVEFHAFPDTGNVPCVCDMSSDFMWRGVDVSRFGLIYAGAQKNLGPSGVVVVIVKKELVASGRKDIPTIFQYRTAADNNSLYNTPPTFAIYLMRNVLAWAKDIGGMPAMEKRNLEKASTLYEAIDQSGGFYLCPVENQSRSVMNVVFRLPSEPLEEKLVLEAKKAKMVGIKGHRSVGGIRISLYNAVNIEWVRTLTSFMKEFAKANG